MSRRGGWVGSNCNLNRGVAAGEKGRRGGGRDENGRENTQTIPVSVFFSGNGNGIGGRENESDITGYRERNISVGNMSITIGKR